MKKTIILLYIIVLFCMGTATIIESFKGTDFTYTYIYGTWWFTVLWALLAASGLWYFIKRKMRKPSIVALHISFIVILLGGLLTHLFSEQGLIHLQQDKAMDAYFVKTKDGQEIVKKSLPFTIKMQKFSIKYHEGTQAPADFITSFVINDNGKQTGGTVSMNNIFTYKGMRLYQTSYDEDGRGSVLALNRDRYGIAVTYTGYALLFLSLVWMLIDPKGAYRKLLRSTMLTKGFVFLLLALAIPQQSSALPTTLPAKTANKFGMLYVLYNDRICPLQTLALDFTKKLYGKPTYKGLTAEQVLTGWIFWPEEWNNEPCIKIKGGALKSELSLPDYASFRTFVNPMTNTYTLETYVEEYYNGKQNKQNKQAADIDDKLHLALELQQGILLKIFPHSFTHAKGHVYGSERTPLEGVNLWFSPRDSLPANMGQEQKLFVRYVFELINERVMAGDYAKVEDYLRKIKIYQVQNGGTSLPSKIQYKAERFYNRVPFATILFMLNLTMGLLTLFVFILRMTGKEAYNRAKTIVSNVADKTALPIMCISFAALTVCEALRWIISGTIPMANGYETMLFVAWTIMLLSLITYRRFHIVLTFGFLMSGFFLLVSHIGQMNPAIGHVMPVLNSPLLSIHVSIIMTSYALLSITFICALVALLTDRHNRHGVGQHLQLLSRLFLYPALTTLGIGIFVGAIWANVSWGQYWAWDPKEVWALITFMVYAIAMHTQSLPSLNRPSRYHIFMLAAFITVLMTYFGVNYFLGGMHSYA